MDIDIGTRFTRLVVLSKGTPDHNKRVRWLCQCDCGEVSLVVGTYLRKGVTRSCGCLMREHAQKIGLAAKGHKYLLKLGTSLIHIDPLSTTRGKI